MSDDANSQRIRLRRAELWSLVALVIGGEIIGIGGAFATRASNPELFKIFATAAATLFFGSLLGGVISLVIADFDRRRLQRAAQLQFIANVLSDLKSVYDGVDRGAILLRAHQSAKTYGEVMKEFIAADVKLRSVVRALDFDERGKPIAAIHREVKSMEQYLRNLIEEFERRYKTVSRIQSLYEARMKSAVEATAQTKAAGPADPALPGNEPWDAIANFPHVKDFIGSLRESETKSGYSDFFLDPLDRASVLLRGALLAEFQ